MATLKTFVTDLPQVTDPAQFEIPGFDRNTNAGGKALMSDLKGDTGPAPNITVSMTTVPYGTAPSVDKSGTNTAPNFNIKFPLAQNGLTPKLQVANDYIQYRYSDTDSWVNLVSLDTLRLHFTDLTAEQVDSLKLHFSDLTDADIAELQQPALDAAATANNAANAANTAAGAANTATTAANSARDAANTAATAANNAADAATAATENVKDGEDGKTPVFAGSTAMPLDPSEPPAASLIQTGTDDDGNPIYALTLGIPQGLQGEQGLPPVLVNGTIATGAPGSDVSFTLTYSGDDAGGSPVYRVDGSIPQGAPGSGNGNVEIDASTLEVGKQYVFTPNENGSPIGTFQELVIPDDQIQADYGQTDTTAKDYIKNKPSLATVATSGAYGDLSGKPNLTPSFVTGNTYAATATGVAQSLQNRSIQNGVETDVVVQMPVATEDIAGVMPASAFAQIQENTATIQSIIQGGGKEWPSMATYADLVAFGMPSSATQNDVIKVRDDETQDGATTQYVATDNGSGLEWVFNLIVNFDPVGLATTTTPGLKKSSTADGQTFTEADGTDSVNGWDALKQRVTNVETASSANTGERTFNTGYNTVTTLVGVPVSKRSVLANLTGDDTLSLSGTLAPGREMSVKARNTGSAEITITLTNNATWESKNTKGENIDNVKIPVGGAIEINIWSLDKLIVKTDA